MASEPLGHKNEHDVLGRNLAHVAYKLGEMGRTVSFQATFTVDKDGMVYLDVGEIIKPQGGSNQAYDHEAHAQQVYPHSDNK